MLTQEDSFCDQVIEDYATIRTSFLKACALVFAKWSSAPWPFSFSPFRQGEKDVYIKQTWPRARAHKGIFGAKVETIQ